MEDQPKVPEEILSEIKNKIKKKTDAMFDWDRSDRIKEKLFPQLNDLTEGELRYCLQWLRYLDDQTQLRGPFSSVASDKLVEDEDELTKLTAIVGQKRTEKLKKLMM